MLTSPERIREKALLTLKRVPALSPTINRLLSLTATADCDLNSLTGLVEADPTLSGEFLGIANSALYARAGRVTSVQHSLTILGLTTVARYALSLSFARIFNRLRPSRIFRLQLFNLHSSSVGTLSDMLAAELPVSNPECAFIAGLLHDFGRLLFAVAIPEFYEQPFDLAALTGRPVAECERELFGIDHAELSCLAVEQWGLGDAVTTAIRYHHSPYDDPAAHSGLLPLSHLLSQSDGFINALGISLTVPENGAVPVLEFPEHPFNRDRVLCQFAHALEALSHSLGGVPAHLADGTPHARVQAVSAGGGI